MLTVTAVEGTTGSTNNITITNDENRLTKEEMEKMVADAERYRLDDVEQRKRSSTRNELEYYCWDAKTSTANITAHSATKSDLLEMCDYTIDWLDDDPSVTVEEMMVKKEEIKQLWNAMNILPDGNPSEASLEDARPNAPIEGEEIIPVAEWLEVIEEID